MGALQNQQWKREEVCDLPLISEIVSLRFFSLKRMSPCFIKFSHSKTPQITRYFRNTTYLIMKHNYLILVEKVHETSSAQSSL